MQEHDKWLRIAHEDLAAARILLKNELFTPLAYHCQQAAEKALKAYLVCKSYEPPKTHDLSKLLELCMKFDRNFETLYDPTEQLNPFSTKFRYPTEFDIPDQTDAELAIKNAQRILNFSIKKIVASATGQVNIFAKIK